MAMDIERGPIAATVVENLEVAVDVMSVRLISRRNYGI